MIVGFFFFGGGGIVLSENVDNLVLYIKMCREFQAPERLSEGRVLNNQFQTRTKFSICFRIPRADTPRSAFVHGHDRTSVRAVILYQRARSGDI